MSRGVVRFLAAFAVCAAAQAASAQVTVPILLWKYLQPWTNPWHSHESVVRDCSGGPVPFARRAFDDWICTQTGPIRRFTWWGTSPRPQQIPNRPFYIAIYSDVQCKPAQLLYQICLPATSQQVGIDCRDRRVYRFNAVVPAGVPVFTQQAGQRYWLQISEADIGGAAVGPSPTPGAVDFEWSAHRPIRNCPALQRDVAGNQIQPLLDACDNQPDDLAFGLYRNFVTGTIPMPPTFTSNSALPRPVFVAEWRRPGQASSMHTESFTLDDDGTFYLDPELPPGQYTLAIRGMSLRPSFFDIFVGFEPIDLRLCCGGVPVAAGDVNGDGFVDFSDISPLLANWMPKPMP